MHIPCATPMQASSLAFSPPLHTLSLQHSQLYPLVSAGLSRHQSGQSLQHGCSKTLLPVRKNRTNPLTMHASARSESPASQFQLNRNMVLRSMLALAAFSVVGFSADASASATGPVAWARAPPTYIHRATGRLHRWDAYDNTKRDWFENHDSLFAENQVKKTEKFARDRSMRRKEHEGYTGDKYMPVLASVFCGMMVLSVGAVLNDDKHYDPFNNPGPWD